MENNKQEIEEDESFVEDDITAEEAFLIMFNKHLEEKETKREKENEKINLVTTIAKGERNV